ncbi:MAG: SDR family NAD(P)-dependent oxidoreductase [Alphaproteobacteria bacterium]
MKKKILVTGGTDGIGLATAKFLCAEGHQILLHGRNEDKLAKVKAELEEIAAGGSIQTYCADLSNLSEVKALADRVERDHAHIDVLINNAGLLKGPAPRTDDGYDFRFVVNAVAPYLLTQLLLPRLSSDSRVINLSSAAQAPVDIEALLGKGELADFDAYAQSKLALTMWSFDLAARLGADGPAIIAVNPASLLNSKMVRESTGAEGRDIGIGARVLGRAALSDDFGDASGRYYDNDNEQFANPHADALDSEKNREVVAAIEQVIADSVGRSSN